MEASGKCLCFSRWDSLDIEHRRECPQFKEPEKSLIHSNPYLRGKVQRERLLRASAKSSTRIER
jgi:hypothetical protein